MRALPIATLAVWLTGAGCRSYAPAFSHCTIACSGTGSSLDCPMGLLCSHGRCGAALDECAPDASATADGARTDARGDLADGNTWDRARDQGGDRDVCLVDHCGACHSCLGGGCAGDVCQAVEVIAAAPPVAVAGGYVYFVSNSTISRRLVTGGLSSLVAPVESVPSLVVDGSYVYFSVPPALSSCKSSFRRVPAIGDTSTLALGTLLECGGTNFRTNASYLLAGTTLSTGYIERLPKAGGQSEIIFRGLSFSLEEFAVDDNFVYLIAASDVLRVPVAGGDALTLATLPAGETPKLVARLGDQLVFVSDSRVGKISADNIGPASTIVEGGGYKLAVDRETQAVYIFRAISGAANCSGGSQLLRIRLAGGPAEELVREAAGCVPFLTVDGAAVYWLGTGTSAGSVLKMTGK
jgi:hypothetical protein